MTGSAPDGRDDAPAPAGRGARLVRRLDALPAAVLPLFVGGLALLLRVWALFEQRAGNPLFRRAILDDAVYLDLARQLLADAPPRPWFLAPLCPWTLAQAGRVFPLDMLTACAVSVVAGALAAALAAVCARALHSQAAGYLAGTLYAVAGTLVYHEILPGQEPLLSLLHVAGLWAAFAWLRRGGVAAAGVLGLLAGVAVLGRATSLALPLAAALIAVRRLRSGAWRGVAVLAVGLVVVLLPAALRNGAVAGAFTPLPWSGGPNLYASNGPDSRERVVFASAELGGAPDVMEQETRRTAEEALGRELGAYDVSAYWVGRTWEDRGSVAELAVHALRKAALFWSVAEYGNNHWIGLERRWSTWLRFTPVSAWWLLALGLAGWWVVRPRTPAVDVVALSVLLLWALLVVMYPVSRYRLVAVPLAIVCFGAGAAELLGGSVSSRRARTALGLLAAAAAVAFVGPLIRPPVPPGAAYVNVAGAYYFEGDLAAAQRLLEEAARRDPEDGRVRYRLATLLVADARYEEALEHLRVADRDDRTRLLAGASAIHVLVRLRRLDAAEDVRAYLAERHAAELAGDAEFWANSALLAAARGDAARYGEWLERARRIAPEHPAVQRAERLQR